MMEMTKQLSIFLSFSIGTVSILSLRLGSSIFKYYEVFFPHSKNNKTLNEDRKPYA